MKYISCGIASTAELAHNGYPIVLGAVVDDTDKPDVPVDQLPHVSFYMTRDGFRSDRGILENDVRNIYDDLPCDRIRDRYYAHIDIPVANRETHLPIVAIPNKPHTYGAWTENVGEVFKLWLYTQGFYNDIDIRMSRLPNITSVALWGQVSHYENYFSYWIGHFPRVVCYYTGNTDYQYGKDPVTQCREAIKMAREAGFDGTPF